MSGVKTQKLKLWLYQALRHGPLSHSQEDEAEELQGRLGNVQHP